MNPLNDCGLPRFFKIANIDELGIDAPEIRLGDAVTLWVRSLSEMQKEAVVLSKRTGIAWRLASDEGAYLQGLDEAPCPLAFMTAGMASSFMNEILAALKERQIAYGKIRLVQDNYYTMEGSMPRRTMIGGALPVHIEVDIEADVNKAQITQLVQDAVVAAPVNGLLGRKLSSLFTLVQNGQEVRFDEPKSLGKPPHADPSDRFSLAKVAADVETAELVIRDGMSPQTDEITSYSGSSYASEQSRRLHLRGICTIRPDGLKEIEQHIYNPHGSIFRLLSDEAPVNGGLGRAPDANSYISVGIGFCFMTQFGRFIKIMNKQLDEYRIIQDMHFSLGGLSGATGQPGSADPVETHVYLKSPEDEAFARDILYMGERTCFLHALCRSELKTRISICS
jgi:uncharacterized OsmC-like protein